MKQVNVYRDSGCIGIEEIERFEKLVGYKFQINYKKLISQHNALRSANDCFDFEFKSKKDIYRREFLWFQCFKQYKHSQKPAREISIIAST